MPDWMNWGGWRWIGQLGAWGLGCWFGWAIRSTNARSEIFRLKLKAEPSIGLVERLASCTEPRDASSQEDEVEAFSHYVRVAKSIVGDLSDDIGGHPND